MRFRHLTVLLFVFALVGVAQQAYGKEQWTSVRSKNFYLIGDASEKEITRAARNFEEFREALGRLFPTLRFSSPVPITVIVFKNEKSFKPFKPLNEDGKTNEWTAGYFHPRADANYIVMSAEGNRRQVYEIIFHEYFHFVSRNTFGRSQIPPWLNEGLAEYYDTTEIDGPNRVRIGNLNSNHLYTLRNNRLIPLEEFIAFDHFTLNQQKGHGANIFYAQAWAFMHFLVHGNGGARASLVNRYLNAVRQGSDPAEAFPKVFGTSYAEMDKEFRAYIARNSYTGFVVTLDTPLAVHDRFPTRSISNADAKAILGDLMAGMRRVAEAEVLLKEALAEDVNHSFANSTLGMIRMNERRFTEARELMRRAVESGASSHLAHYRYAYLLSRERMDGNGFVTLLPPEVSAEIRERLRHAIKLDPGFPESYRLLGFVSLVNNDELDESIEYLNTALRLAPGNEYYKLDLAELYARKGDFERGGTMAKAVRAGAPDDAVRQHASYVIERIARLESIARTSGDRFTIASGPPPTEEEIEEKLRAHRIAQLNRSIAKPEAGQKRVLGMLTKAECREQLPVFTVETGGGVIKLSAPDLEAVTLRAYVETKGQKIGCETIAAPLRSVIVYEPGVEEGLDGRLISLEVVPEEFEFTP